MRKATTSNGGGALGGTVISIEFSTSLYRGNRVQSGQER